LTYNGKSRKYIHCSSNEGSYNHITFMVL